MVIVFIGKVIIIEMWYMPYVSSGGADPFFLPPSRKSCTTLFFYRSLPLYLRPTWKDEIHFDKLENLMNLNLRVKICV